jgi:hypothetical protein
LGETVGGNSWEKCLYLFLPADIINWKQRR